MDSFMMTSGFTFEKYCAHILSPSISPLATLCHCLVYHILLDPSPTLMLCMSPASESESVRGLLFDAWMGQKKYSSDSHVCLSLWLLYFSLSHDIFFLWCFSVCCHCQARTLIISALSSSSLHHHPHLCEDVCCSVVVVKKKGW